MRATAVHFATRVEAAKVAAAATLRMERTKRDLAMVLSGQLPLRDRLGAKPPPALTLASQSASRSATPSLPHRRCQAAAAKPLPERACCTLPYALSAQRTKLSPRLPLPVTAASYRCPALACVLQVPSSRIRARSQPSTRLYLSGELLAMARCASCASPLRIPPASTRLHSVHVATLCYALPFHSPLLPSSSSASLHNHLLSSHPSPPPFTSFVRSLLPSLPPSPITSAPQIEKIEFRGHVTRFMGVEGQPESSPGGEIDELFDSLDKASMQAHAHY